MTPEQVREMRELWARRPSWPILNGAVELADSWLVQGEALAAAQQVIDAALLIQAYDQAGGNDWWEAHAKLYAALASFSKDTTDG
jgi:hypothetical protein